MTYVFNRQRPKLRKDVFPFHSYRKRLCKVVHIEELGTFAFDKVGIVTEPRMNIEDFPCDEKPQCIRLKKGFLHFFRFAGHSYEVFQGKGRYRTILFPARDFKSLQHLKSYVKNVIGNRDYHLTKVDFAFYLSKKFFTVDFLFFSFWAKGYILDQEEVRFYQNPLHVKMNNSKRQSFTVGKQTRFSFYDCDVHNLNKKRDEKKMVNHLINFELGVRTKSLRRAGIQHLNDLKKLPLKCILDCVEFFAPSNTAFKNTTAEPLLKDWRENGLQKFMGKLSSRWKNYDRITPKMLPLMISDRHLKAALICLAELEHDRWIMGRSIPWRFGVQSARYLITKQTALYDTEDF